MIVCIASNMTKKRQLAIGTTLMLQRQLQNNLGLGACDNCTESNIAPLHSTLDSDRHSHGRKLSTIAVDLGKKVGRDLKVVLAPMSATKKYCESPG
jgi:hypothetical protein